MLSESYSGRLALLEELAMPTAFSWRFVFPFIVVASFWGSVCVKKRTDFVKPNEEKTTQLYTYLLIWGRDAIRISPHSWQVGFSCSQPTKRYLSSWVGCTRQDFLLERPKKLFERFAARFLSRPIISPSFIFPRMRQQEEKRYYRNHSTRAIVKRSWRMEMDWMNQWSWQTWQRQDD